MNIAFSIPGEQAIVALANLIQALAAGQSPEQRAQMWQRYLDLSEPWQKIAVELSKDAAGLVQKLMQAGQQK